MKNIFKSLFVLLSGILLFTTSCTDNFEEINTNPYGLTKAEPEYLFGLAPVQTLRTMAGTNNWFIFGNYGNQWAQLGGTGPHFGYDGRAEGIWNSFYVNSLNPLYQIISNYGDNPAYKNRVAIARIWKCYVLSQLVGLYGPCPYTHACNALPSIPYDTEETVYRGILQELKDAYTALDPDGDRYPKIADPFLTIEDGPTYIARWSQFAHCIRLRTAIRLTEVPEEWAPGLANEAIEIVVEELNNAEKGLLITSNGPGDNDNKTYGNFYMQFAEDTENQNPLYREVIANPELTTADPGNWPVIHESLTMWMSDKNYNDPVLDIYMKEGTGTSHRPKLDPYLGRPHSMDVPSGYQWNQGLSSPYSNLKYEDFATINKTFSGMTAKFYFFSYPELLFIMAEAKIKGYWNGPKTAEEYYYEGIDARCAKYGITGSSVQTYKDQPGIKWSTPSDTVGVSINYRDYLGGFVDSYLGGEEDNFKRIIVQHWISLFSQNIDVYTLLRRTEVIPFKPHFGVAQSEGYVDGRWGYTPERLRYPGAERTINTTETQKAIYEYLFDNTLHEKEDQVTFRLIFAKFNPGLDEPHEGTQAYGAFPYPLPNVARNVVNAGK